MADKSSSSSGGIGFVGLLTIVFITLKLCGVITWSWWWVLAPMWIAIGFGFLVILPLYVLLCYLTGDFDRLKSRRLR